MNSLQTHLEALTRNSTFNGEVGQDVQRFLIQHNRPGTAIHCAEVAAEARRLAGPAGVDPEQAAAAAYLHDVSAVFPRSQLIDVARAAGLEVLPEEEAFPMIVHQKVSAVLARELFAIRDEAVLRAIACHTTLRPAPTPLDCVVFVADKIAWDQPGRPPYLDALLAALDESIEAAALVYLSHLWDQHERLQVVHPWLQAAYLELSGQHKNNQ